MNTGFIRVWGIYLHFWILFGVIRNPALADYIYLNLSRILKLVLNALRNIPCQQYHIVIADLFRNNHDTNLTACLNSKRFIYSLKGIRYIF